MSQDAIDVISVLFALFVGIPLTWLFIWKAGEAIKKRLRR